jgi:hypothetical protein
MVKRLFRGNSNTAPAWASGVQDGGIIHTDVDRSFIRSRDQTKSLGSSLIDIT